MRITPPPTFVPQKITRRMEFYFHCASCPNPHRVVLCTAHASQVVAGAQPFYGPADADESCRLCDMAEEIQRQYEGEPMRIRAFLDDPPMLIEAAMQGRFRRAA